MPTIPIQIALIGNVVRPHNDAHTVNNRTTKAKPSDTVVWVIPPGFTGASVQFTTASPFGTTPDALNVPYGSMRQIPPTAPAGRFQYSCKLRDANGVEHSSEGGGELEIGN